MKFDSGKGQGNTPGSCMIDYRGKKSVLAQLRTNMAIQMNISLEQRSADGSVMTSDPHSLFVIVTPGSPTKMDDRFNLMQIR
jgi:hypothetical protein